MRKKHRFEKLRDMVKINRIIGEVKEGAIWWRYEEFKP
jgi:hypothetical protein